MLEILGLGGVAERLKAPVLKTGVAERSPWVRIPPPPPKNSTSARLFWHSVNVHFGRSGHLTTRLDHHGAYLLAFSLVRSASILEAASAIIPRSM
jgi:hypothetical protein